MLWSKVSLCQVLDVRCGLCANIASYNESNLGMAVEIFWHEEPQCVAEMRLVVDSAKERGDGRFGFVDIFAGDSEREFGRPNHILVLELKHISLVGLWKAMQPDPHTDWNLIPIVEALAVATEDELLDRQYFYFNECDHEWHRALVRDTLGAAVE
jgi:hypothetical protein